MSPDRIAMLALAGSLLAVFSGFMWRRPKLLAVTWILAVTFVPVWAGITVGIGFQPAAYVGLFVLALLFTDREGRRLPLRWYDLAVVVFFALCVVASQVGASTLEAATVPVVKWGVGYAVGRVLYARVGGDFLGRCLTVAFGVAAAMGIVESLSGTNIFFDFPMGKGNSAYRAWAVLQERAGYWRAEAAFGHSIAFGCSIAMALPLMVVSSFRPWVKILSGAVMAGALVLSFSRLSLIVAGVGLALTVLSPASGLSRRIRGWVLSGMALFAVVAMPFILATVDEAGSEAEESALYRGRLWDLADTVELFGLASSAHISPSGTLYFGQFRSIDNAVLLGAMTYGWLPIALASAILLVGAVALLRGRYSAPLAGVLAQTPGLFSVAFITQYEVFYWALVGMACAAAAESHEEHSSAGQDPESVSASTGKADPDVPAGSQAGGDIGTSRSGIR
ncbi:hypothetical protein SAMN05421595_2896 [Austwickia chelonae]|uniref:O-antigen polymerase family protein n=1 Tax=Austwickia chelonae NBRC 105200 TaxID=1184607 RepID=K6UNK1_9MICO|nr:hypothetical protein [Austwickia chelonae]GAB79036.1 hypothetical protein AUCHE_18_00370 [Austwickia chelonae NBRC 105200]SEW41773.1 hypothetical protein SAMN05421595_2896 [Austwickia chelonae]